ncbi:glutamate--cysteine ligase [Amphibiibacter pelophylacis]|uniref:Glutamate--cysteine ligase n=1 Tax=Amphibiibacter pelophylacis TaxID=1799477 RepID=A0ACC6P4U8_9BURK
MVPHLVTSLTGPINELEQRILESMPVIERWFRLEWMEHTPPFYCSVDVRNAGFKIAPVDTNLYPGGFNNLTPDMLPLAVQAAMALIEKICPEAKNLLLIPENHTRNHFYLANVKQLMTIFHMAGLNVRLGSLDPAVTQPTDIQLADGSVLTTEPLIRERGRIKLKHFDPCTILLNNDLSAGIPDILRDLHEQYLLPPLQAGWAVRTKSRHFQSYEEVAKKFSKVLGMDPWLINPLFENCPAVDFAEGTGLECVQNHVDSLLGRIRRKYKEYGITEKPFVIVKADNGTYGMGIMTVRDAKDLDSLNRRSRNKMSTVKDGQALSRVIIQEGVPTSERIEDSVAEPVVYMMDRYVVGGFYRVHGERGIDENLNSPGARFVPMELARLMGQPQIGPAEPNRFYMYGVLGRLALLAASYEMEATDPQAEQYD